MARLRYDLSTGHDVSWKRASRVRLYPVEEVDGAVFVSI